MKKRFYLCLIVLLLTFFNWNTLFSTIRYVKAGATGNGSSWADASGDLQEMINQSAENDEIWVAGGSYVPAKTPPAILALTTDHRNNTFLIYKNISLFGGFAGFENHVDDRDLKAHATVLNGDQVYHVVVFANGCEAVLDGFVIEGGHANGNASVSVNGKEVRQDAGGGVYILRSSPRLNRVTVKNNTAICGGGIYSFHAFPVLTNVVLNHNSAQQGGGIYNYYSFPSIVNTTVSQNQGGGLFNSVSKAELSNSVVWGNGDDLYNDVTSHTAVAYSLIQNEIKETQLITHENAATNDQAGLFLFVSPNGKDSNAGTEHAPLATLAGARNKIRELKASSQVTAGGIIVYFKGGTYPVTETTFFREEDSGTASSPITYKAFPGETPLFTGGFYIEGKTFEKVKDAIMLERLAPDVRDKVVCFDLFANGWRFDDLDYSKDFWKQDDLREHVVEDFYDNQFLPRQMQVYMDDDALYLARYPNKTAGLFAENPYRTYLRIAEIHGGKGVPGFEGEEAWDGKNPTFRVDEPRIRNWRNHDDIIVSGMLGTHFENDRKLIKTIDTDQLIIELKSMPVYGLFDDGRVAFENVFEELDKPGEYYIDKNTGILYLYPVSALKDATVKVSRFDQNFMIDAKDVSYVSFSGLTFELSKGSIFYIRGGRNCAVENCNLKNFGIWGIRLGENAISPAIAVEAWSKGLWDEYVMSLPSSVNGFNHRVSGCNFLNTGYHACLIASGNAGTREPGHMVFENNVITHSGLIGSTYRSGLCVVGNGISIKNNSFFYCLGQAINGNITDTEIIYNEFCDSPCDMAEDTGTIYLNYLNGNDGVKIRYNFFHDVTNADNRFGIYFGHALRGAAGYDNNAPFKDFSYNVVYNYPGAGYLSIISPSTTIGNLFIDCDVAIPYYAELFDLFKGRTAQDLLNEEGQSTIATFYKSGLYKTDLWKEKYPELYDYFEYMANGKSDLQQPMDQIYNNLFVNINKPFHDRNSSLEDLQLPESVAVDPIYGKIGNNRYIFYDPGFPSVSNRNFQLSEAVARHLGMDWIDMHQIGASTTQRSRAVLPVTSAFVRNETELKEALADGSIDAILFANNITLNHSELVINSRRAKPHLVIDGNGYTLTELLSNKSAFLLKNKGDVRSVIVRNMKIEGRNRLGHVRIEPESVELVFRNVSYQGPKLTENTSGSVLIDNSEIHVSFAQGGNEMGEAVKANKIRFIDNVNILKEYDSDGTMEAVLKLTGLKPSLIIETFPRGTGVNITYKGLEVEEYRFAGGGGAIDADHPFDFIIGSNAGMRYKGVYEFLPRAKPSRIEEKWNSYIGICIDVDVNRGVADKILSVEGDVLINSASSITIDVLGLPQCLMEVNGHFDMRPGSYLWLGGFYFDPTSPENPVAQYPMLLMKGGSHSKLTIDRPTEVQVCSHQSSQDWMRAIGFRDDGEMKFTANQFSFTDRTPGNEVIYEPENSGYITIEAQIKGGAEGITQSLSCHTTDNSPLKSGAIHKESVNLKNITRFQLTSVWDSLKLDAGVFVKRGDEFVEPDKYAAGIGNLHGDNDPLFQEEIAGDFKLKKESPLIDAGFNQRYKDVMNLYLLNDKKDISGNGRIIGDAIDIGAYEYDPSDTGNNLFLKKTDFLTAWTQQGKLHLRSERPVRLSIYSVSGVIIRKVELKTSETSVIPLARGIYMVVPDHGRALKVMMP